MKIKPVFITVLFFLILSAYGQKGFEIYTLKTAYKPVTGCTGCFYPEEKDMAETPLLTSADIKQFSSDFKTLSITDSGRAKLNSLGTIPLQTGIPLVVAINHKPVFGFLLWNAFSSFGSDWLIAFIYGNELSFTFGVPNPKAGLQDPRADKRLLEYTQKKG